MIRRPGSRARKRGASGALSPAHVFGEGVQRARLESEGVTFRPDGCIDLDRHVWLIAGK